jgi:hypothetical protein
MAGLAAVQAKTKAVMIISRRTEPRPAWALKNKGRGRLIGRTKGGMNTKLHAICDNWGRPLNLPVAAGQVSGSIGAWAWVSSLPAADWLLGPSHGLQANRCRATDRGYDADWFREA